MPGCKDCEHCYIEHGFLKCGKKPWDYKTDEQQEIAIWLRKVGNDARTEPGCPGFLHFMVRRNRERKCSVGNT